MPDPMVIPTPLARAMLPPKAHVIQDRLLLGSSLVLQVVLGLFLGHAYDMRIFMATGYLVGTGRNPYLVQDVSAFFHNSAFQGITSFGYPPPWALVLGWIYQISYRVIPNFLLYNLAIKLPIIAANIGLAYLAVFLLKKMGVQENISRRAWIFLLFNPFLLLTSSAWGEFDPIVALLALLSLYWLSEGKLIRPAILLALAISLKPTPLGLIPVIFVYLAGRSWRQTIKYFTVFGIGMVLFCVAPFFVLGWDPSPILQHWNIHFTVGGGLSYMTFLEYIHWSYQLPMGWGFIGWLWIPALGIAAYTLRTGIGDFKDLLKKSVAFLLVFFLTRAWLSETNINLILPMAVLLVSVNALDGFPLAALWVLPLVFSLVNTSIAQLLFPSEPGLMDALLQIAVKYYAARYALRTVIVIFWIVTGWRTVLRCLRKNPPAPEMSSG
jgi:hypothetical protein